MLRELIVLIHNFVHVGFGPGVLSSNVWLKLGPPRRFPLSLPCPAPNRRLIIFLKNPRRAVTDFLANLRRLFFQIQNARQILLARAPLLGIVRPMLMREGERRAN